MASNLYGRGMDLSLDETLQTGPTRPGRVDSDLEQESTSALHKDTVEKLNEFSARLRALKSPGVIRAPGFNTFLKGENKLYLGIRNRMENNF